MYKNILIIDDQEEQASSLATLLASDLGSEGFLFEHYSKEDEILAAIENRFYSLAIVDIRMDDYSIDGLDIAKTIKTINPFAKVLLVSAFKEEYVEQINELIKEDNIIGVSDKKSLDTWRPELKEIIKSYYEQIESNTALYKLGLLDSYSEIKNTTNAYIKGTKFERFLSQLFGSIGFLNVEKRVIDQSRNEVDLIIRNDHKDTFLNKFGKYILVECKNKPDDSVGKNDFIVFFSKLNNTSNLSELGILATTGSIAKTTYIEATRESQSSKKIIFLDNPAIEKLIMSDNKLETFKKIIDSQVKDNK